MKPVLPFLLLAPLALAQGSAQGNSSQGNRGTFRNGDVSIQGSLRSGRLLPNGGVAFDLYGGVSMTATKAGLSVTAGSARGETVRRKDPKASALRKGELLGNVVVTRTVEGETSVLKGSRAIIDTSDGIGGTVLLFGPVSFSGEGKAGRSVIATGQRGSARLGPDAEGNSAIQSAAVAGNVRIAFEQAPVAGEKTPAGTYVATGDRAVLDFTETGSLITMTGNVKLTGKGENSFDVDRISKVVIRRNLAGEATAIDFDGGGADTVTTVRTGKKKG